MAVQLDDGRSVAFDVKDYSQVDHGYAATIHKAQGMTVDRTYVLATPGMDSHAAYVALSRHRDGVDLHYGQDDFADQGKLVRTLSRGRGKDMASDYARDSDPERAFAERRGITFRERVVELIEKVVPEKVRGMFDGLQLRVSEPEPRAPEPQATPEPSIGAVRKRAFVRHAQAVDDIFETQDAGGRATPEQRRELAEARRDLDALRDDSSRDAEAAYKRDPTLANEAANGAPERARRAMLFEGELRTDPSRRADRFVERWNKLEGQSQRAYEAGDMQGRKAIRNEMASMAKSLEKDPQMDSLLANRKAELGITFDTGRSLGVELALNHGIDLEHGLGIGM
jgi:hypothetical protein